MKAVAATRYVTPLREGGSLPAIVEADDSGLYVVKFRGAGQGVKALIAEVVSGGIGRALGLRIPELVTITVPPALGRNEPDDEIRDLLRASVGVNLGVDFLPGAITFDPAVDPPPPEELASSIVWFDAFVTNVDRTARNPNLLSWHRELHLIDHGASLYFHHDWGDTQAMARTPFSPIRDHVLLAWASDVPAADRSLKARLDRATLQRILAEVPDEWLTAQNAFSSAEAGRAAYREYLEARLAASSHFVEEAVRARTKQF